MCWNALQQYLPLFITYLFYKINVDKEGFLLRGVSESLYKMSV